MLPIIALIGRSNVGKSTLFNVLTKTRNALVSHQTKLTRDRQYGLWNINRTQQSILIDTAGFDAPLNEIEKKAYKQTLIAIQKANLIFFIVDAQSGLTNQDCIILDKVRKYNKKIILIVNKIDNIETSNQKNEFYSLGFAEIHQISASHKTGINVLISQFLLPWMHKNFNNKNKTKIIKNNNKKQKKEIKITCIGRPNVGKSTLINALLRKERMITCNTPGTTLNSVSVPIQHNNKKYIFTDTAGIPKNKKKQNSITQFSIMKTLQTVKKTDVSLLIIDASIEICQQDLKLANFILKSGKPIILVFNKSDLINSSIKKQIKNTIKKQCAFLSLSKIHFISALHKTRLSPLFQLIHKIYQSYNIEINTSELTKTLHEAIKKHQPPMTKGYKIKLKYAHIGSFKPLKIIIHGNRTKYLSTSYKRYLVNFFCRTFKVNSVPIHIKFKDSTNPYCAKKRNVSF